MFMACNYISLLYGSQIGWKELLRIKSYNEEVYIIPIVPESKEDFHVSHHRSGKFHWKMNGKSITPAFGELDMALALRSFLQFRGCPIGIRLRGNLEENQIKKGLEKLQVYLPFELDVNVCATTLFSKGRLVWRQK